ncbi:MAG TPA: NAD(P)-binding protein, partial [Blastocatellia bacterium]|nr:NAD(P)-binding protein [Blastocatellia bacterium]
MQARCLITASSPRRLVFLMSHSSAEVAIVGAGPAGAHLACRLAAEGREVVLFDPKGAWEKPCGGG